MVRHQADVGDVLDPSGTEQGEGKADLGTVFHGQSASANARRVVRVVVARGLVRRQGEPTKLSLRRMLCGAAHNQISRKAGSTVT